MSVTELAHTPDDLTRPARSSSLRSSLTFVLLTGERFLQMAVGILVVSTIARQHSTESFAAWQIAYSMWVVAMQISGVAGERVMLPRLCREQPAQMHKLLDTMLRAKVLAGLMAAGVLIVWSATAQDRSVLLLALLWSVYLLIAETAGLAAHWRYAVDDFILPQIARSCGLGLRVLIVLMLIWTDAPIEWFVLSWILEAIVFMAVLYRGWTIRPRLFTRVVDWAEFRTLFAQGGALAFMAAVGAALPRTDRLFGAGLIDTTTIAHYSAAMSLLEALFGISAVLTTIVGAKYLFRPEPLSVRLHAAIAGAAVLVALTMTVLLQLAGPAMVDLVFGPRFARTADYLAIASWLLPLVYLQAITQAPLIARASGRYHIIRGCAALAAGLLVTLFVIQHGSAQWLSLGAFAGYASFLLLDLLWLIRERSRLYARRA